MITAESLATVPYLGYFFNLIKANTPVLEKIYIFALQVNYFYVIWLQFFNRLKCRSILSLAVNILADIIQNPVLDEGAIERERGVILREMQVLAYSKLVRFFSEVFSPSTEIQKPCCVHLSDLH